MFTNVLDVAKYATSGAPEKPIDREAIAKIPYATMSAKLGKGRRSILVLSRYRENDLHWVSSDGALLVTRRGRLVQTAGFTDNLKATIIKETDPLTRMNSDSKGSRVTHRVIDVVLDGVYRTIPIKSTLEIIGPETIEIAGLTFDTILVRERNKAQSINWTFDNYYWVDPYDGYVWKSVQHFSRNLPPLKIEVLKPEG